MEPNKSPEKKKIKLTDPANRLKRECETERGSKRAKVEKNELEDIKAMKRKNFVTACEQVSFKAYFDHQIRLQLIYLPACADKSACKHQDYKNGSVITEMASYAEELVRIEMKTNMWNEVLEVCQLCITPDQYLSANVLKDIVEIMLNAQEVDPDYTIPYLIDKCQQILSLNFSTHPPCLTKTLRKCYNTFLTSPMDKKEETFTNRSEFGYDKGIVKYCMNRLEYELSIESKDEALVDKYENIPEDMKQSIKGLHWQKEKFEIYEVLVRSERIERLMNVLESIIELLQFDLVIWHSRYTNNQGCHIMRSHKPLMAFILWSNNVLYTGAVNNNCRQILKLFVHMVHLHYPEEHIKIMTNWFNVIVQTFYICESNSNSDFPNTGKYCTTFAKEFYKIISDMPYGTILRILERIQPSFMQHIIGTLHIKKLLHTEEDDVITIFLNFLKISQWEKFPINESEIHISNIPKIKPRKVKIMKYLMKKCDMESKPDNTPDEFYEPVYPKFHPITIIDKTLDQNYIVHIFYITIEAYLDAYSVQLVQETLDSLNEKLENGSSAEVQNILPEFCSYSVTEPFIKKYRSIFQNLQQLTMLLQEMKEKRLPENIKIFKNIGLLE